MDHIQKFLSLPTSVLFCVPAVQLAVPSDTRPLLSATALTYRAIRQFSKISKGACSSSPDTNSRNIFFCRGCYSGGILVLAWESLRKRNTLCYQRLCIYPTYPGIGGSAPSSTIPICSPWYGNGLRSHIHRIYGLRPITFICLCTLRCADR